MRLVFDTNVLIAAFATRGFSAEVFEYCLLQHTILTSPKILEEFERAMAKKLKFEQGAVEAILRHLHKYLVPGIRRPIGKKICRDPGDDHILELAAGSEAQAVITGDLDLLILKVFQNIPIIKPAEFWNFEETSLSQGKMD